MTDPMDDRARRLAALLINNGENWENLYSFGVTQPVEALSVDLDRDEEAQSAVDDWVYENKEGPEFDSYEPWSGEETEEPEPEPVVPLNMGQEREEEPDDRSFNDGGYNSHGDLLARASELSIAEHTISNHTCRTGYLAPEGLQLCSLRAIASYPENFIGTANRAKVKESAFDHGKLFERKWNLFYLYPGLQFSNNRAIILVPTSQFAKFLAEVNRKSGTRLRIPSGRAGMSFRLEFPRDGTPRPRYLGESDSQEMADQLKTAPPPTYYAPEGEDDSPKIDPSDRSLEAFKLKIEILLKSEKIRKAKNKQQKQSDRLAKQKAWSNSLKRVQRYLGLREARNRLPVVTEQYGGDTLEWDGYDQATEATQANPGHPTELDVNLPPRFSMEEDLVFVCVDVESYERNHNLITEIGFSTLDTRDIVSLAPGVDGKNWFGKIRSRHFRIREYSHLVNMEFVKGCPNSFDFGESEFIALNDAPKVVASCFKPPFSGQGQENQTAPKRKVVFVGHDAMGDVKYLQNMGYNVLNLPPHEIVDTAELYRFLRRENSSRFLGGVLADLGIAGWNLHNAGNDAVYTLQSMVVIAVRAIKEVEARQPGKVDEERIAKAAEAAKSEALDEQQAWSDDDGDGGPPVKPPTEIPEKGKGKAVAKKPDNNNSSKSNGNHEPFFKKNIAWLKKTRAPGNSPGNSSGKKTNSQGQTNSQGCGGGPSAAPRNPNDGWEDPLIKLTKLAARATKSNNAKLIDEIADAALKSTAFCTVLTAIAEGKQTPDQQTTFEIRVTNAENMLAFEASWA